MPFPENLIEDFMQVLRRRAPELPRRAPMRTPGATGAQPSLTDEFDRQTAGRISQGQQPEAGRIGAQAVREALAPERQAGSQRLMDELRALIRPNVRPQRPSGNIPAATQQALFSRTPAAQLPEPAARPPSPATQPRQLTPSEVAALRADPAGRVQAAQPTPRAPAAPRNIDLRGNQAITQALDEIYQGGAQRRGQPGVGRTWIQVPEGGQGIYIRMNPRGLEIANVEIESRGTGAYGRYLSHMEQEASRLGIPRITLENISNPRLPDFYARRGYTPVSGNVRDGTLIMQRDIPAQPNAPAWPPQPLRQLTAEQRAAAYLRDRFGYVPSQQSGSSIALARAHGLTSPETYVPGTAIAHSSLHGAPEPEILRALQAPDAQTAAQQHMARLTSPQPPQAARTGRQPLVPSQAAQLAPGAARAPPAAPPRPWIEQSATARSALEQHVTRRIGLTPTQFADEYFAGLANDTWSSSAYGNHSLQMSGQATMPRDMTLRRRDGTTVTIARGTVLGRMDRTIYWGDHAYNGLFSLNSQYQGLGIAKAVLKRQIALYRQLGIDKVKVNAGLDGGGHVWNLFGFTMDRSNWNDLRHAAPAGGSPGQLRRRLGEVRAGDLTPQQLDLAKRLLDDPNPRAAWRLADMRWPVRLGSSQTPVPLGRALFKGSGWSGTMDLTDAETNARFDAYVANAPW